MAPQLSGHLWNAAILALAVAIAVAAEQLTSVSAAPASAGAGLAGSDISSFIVPAGFDSMVPPFRMPVRFDPFESGTPGREPAVAYLPGPRTVRTPSAPT